MAACNCSLTPILCESFQLLELPDEVRKVPTLLAESGKQTCSERHFYKEIKTDEQWNNSRSHFYKGRLSSIGNVYCMYHLPLTAPYTVLPSRSLSVSCTLRQFLLAFVFQLHNPGPIALLIGYLMLSV